MVAQGSIAILTERLISPREGPTSVARGGSPGKVGDRAVLRPGGAGVSGLAALTPAPPGRAFLAHPAFPGLPPRATDGGPSGPHILRAPANAQRDSRSALTNRL